FSFTSGSLSLYPRGSPGEIVLNIANVSSNGGQDGDEDWLEDDERHRQMEKQRQVEFDKKQQAKNQQQPQPQQSQMEKDPEVNENQIERRSELKNTTSLIQSNQNTQANPNIDLNYISPLHNTPHKPSSPHPQQHSSQPPLEETLAILRTISPGDPRGYKEREPEPQQQKLQQYAGLMEQIERFHEIMKPTIDEEKKKPDSMLSGQYKHQPNKDGPLFFYPPKNYHPTQPIPNKNQEIQTLHNPKANLLQLPHLQNQVKQKKKMQYLNRRYNNLTNLILEAKQVHQSPYPISPQGVPKLEPTPTLLTTSHYSRSGEKRHMQPQLLKTSPQNSPKATRPVQDPRNR
ncbi:MAG: hypothetical protein EZS28_049433, partial [Streblomastix strix]